MLNPRVCFLWRLNEDDLSGVFSRPRLPDLPFSYVSVPCLMTIAGFGQSDFLYFKYAYSTDDPCAKIPFFFLFSPAVLTEVLYIFHPGERPYTSATTAPRNPGCLVLRKPSPSRHSPTRYARKRLSHTPHSGLPLIRTPRPPYNSSTTFLSFRLELAFRPLSFQPAHDCVPFFSSIFHPLPHPAGFPSVPVRLPPCAARISPLR